MGSSAGEGGPLPGSGWAAGRRRMTWRLRPAGGQGLSLQGVGIRQASCIIGEKTYRSMPVHTSRRQFLMASGGVILGCLPGCSSREAALRIASHDWLGYQPLFLARELGFLDEEGVRLVEMPSASYSLQALSAGNVDGAALTLDEVLSARADGLDLRVVLVFDVSDGADVLLAHPDIDSLRDLAGRRVGVESTAVGALMLSEALQAAGLAPASVKLVPLTADRHYAAFTSGQVDAVVTFEPMASRLLRMGARRLFDSRAIPGRIVDVLALRADALDASPRALTGLLGAYFRALGHLRQHPEDGVGRMAARLELPASAVQSSLEGLKLPDLAANHRWLEGRPCPLEQSAAILEKVMRTARLLVRPSRLEDLCAPQFLPPRP